MEGGHSMGIKFIKAVVIFIAIATLLPGTVKAENSLSANIPLNSYIYEYIEKLDGLGYLKDMRTGNKPYTRIQVAKWVQQITGTIESEKTTPPYVKSILSRLHAEFRRELTHEQLSGLYLRDVTIGETYRSGVSYNPLSTYNYGYKYSPHTNESLSFNLENSVNSHCIIALSPRIAFSSDKNTTSLTAGYIKASFNGVELELGKDSLWWGQGFRGSLLLTDNAKPLTFAKLSWSNTTLFYSILETDRSDVKYPSFVGLRKDFKPGANFTFGAALTSMVGGEGHMLGRGDYHHWLSGTNAYSNDKWNSIAGVDFRWRLPRLNGLQLYGEFYGEDQAHFLKIIPIPSEMAEVVGIYLPRITKNGDWEARLEWAHTTPSWYRHSLYTRGYTYYGDLMGDAIAGNAYRYNVNLTHFSPNGSQFAVNLERVNKKNSATPQKSDSFWIALRNPLTDDVFLQTAFGLAKTNNFNFIAGDNKTNYFANLIITRQYR